MAEGWFINYASVNQYGQSTSNSDRNLLETRNVNDLTRSPAHARPYFDSFRDDLTWQPGNGPQSPEEVPGMMFPQGSVPIMIQRPTFPTCYSPGAVSSGHSSMLDHPHGSPSSSYDAVSPSHTFSSSCPPPQLFIQPSVVDPASLSPSASGARGRPRAQSSSSQTHRRSRHGAKSSNMKCPSCSKVVKNTSEAQKHRLQHSKPFLCGVDKCRRHEEGFATKNDLERHRKTVHSLIPLLGEPGGYICVACTDKSKFWPRKDNFRAHCQRKHAGIPTQELLDRSKTDRLPMLSVNTSVETTASSLSDNNDDRTRLAELASSDRNPKSSSAASQATFELLHEDDELAALGAGPGSSLHPNYITTPSIEVRSYDDLNDAPATLDLNAIDAAYGSPDDRGEPVWDFYYHGYRTF